MTLAEIPKINPNQNLLGLVTSFLSLGTAEYYNLSTLYWFSAAASLVTGVSLLITTIAYTKKYRKDKQ